jgi:hypothetical protein
LLLGSTDRAIGLIERFAACFEDGRAGNRIVHDLPTLVGQRVLGMALGYEDLVDHEKPGGLSSDLRSRRSQEAATGRTAARSGQATHKALESACPSHIPHTANLGQI